MSPLASTVTLLSTRGMRTLRTSSGRVSTPGIGMIATYESVTTGPAPPLPPAPFPPVLEVPPGPELSPAPPPKSFAPAAPA